MFNTSINYIKHSFVESILKIIRFTIVCHPNTYDISEELNAIQKDAFFSKEELLEILEQFGTIEHNGDEINLCPNEDAFAIYSDYTRLLDSLGMKYGITEP